MSHDQERRVESWEEAQAALYADSWDPGLGRYRLSRAFRGQPTEAGLESSLARLGETPDHGAEVERQLLRNFEKYATGDALDVDDRWHLLSVAEHHGLPTRLLDWTFSPLVALHFVTADYRATDRDGVVWAVDFQAVHERLPDRFRRELDAEEADVFTTEMLSTVVDGARADEGGDRRSALGTFDDLFGDPVPVFFEPPSIDDRIVNQYALFSVLPDPTTRLDEWLADNPDLFYRVIVPGDVKMEIRDKLDQANVTERVLFPGLDGLASWLERHYAGVSATKPSDDER